MAFRFWFGEGGDPNGKFGRRIYCLPQFCAKSEAFQRLRSVRLLSIGYRYVYRSLSAPGGATLMMPRGLLVTKATRRTISGVSGRSMRICSTACWRLSAER